MKEYIDGDKTYRKLALNELRPTDEGKDDVLLSTIVTGVSEIEHYPELIVYRCPNRRDCTGEKIYERGEGQFDFKDWRDIPNKARCDRCNIEMTQVQITKGQLRKVLLSEQGTTNPIHLTGFIYGDNINKIHPGTKLNLMGILRSRKKKPQSLTFYRLFDITEFRLTDEKPILPTDEEKQYFKDMDKTRLIKSFAPNIRNMYLIKEGLILCCLGGVENENVRGDINALLCGDPGLAKTQLLKFVTKIIRKSDYISGKSASGAGLFGGVDNLADGTRIGKPGSVVMCNGGVACLDEIEKMNAGDRIYCHEVMESQTFSLRKIGIDITWEVKVCIIGAANPKKSIWNPELTIKENVNLPASLLSRFGLIFLVRDIPDKTEDLAIAEHIRKTRAGMVEDVLSPEMMTKFINYAKQINPIMSKEAGDKLTEWWSNLRQVDQKEGSVAIDIRTLEDLHRLTEAYARMDLSESADEKHADRAIQMLNDSLHTLGMSTPGEKNQSLMEHLDKHGYTRFVFNHPITKAQAIADLCKKPNFYPTEESAEKIIDDLQNKLHSIIEQGDMLIWVN